MPGAEALLRLRARPDRPVPVRRRRRRDRLPRADVARADLRARRAPPTEHPRAGSDDDGGDDRPSRRGPTRPLLPAPVHVGRRGAAARAVRPLARRPSASRHWTGSAPPRRTTSTSRTDPAAFAPAASARWCRAIVPACSTTRPELPDGGVGTLWIEGDTAALCYWNEHEKSKRTFHGDSVNTGDLFARDPDGFFWYRAQRRADQGGWRWVAPSEVEHCLISHPDVVECAVVGYEDGGLTRPGARRPPGRGSPLEELAAALQEHVHAHLPAQVPARRPLRGRAAEDAVRQDRPEGAAGRPGGTA